MSVNKNESVVERRTRLLAARIQHEYDTLLKAYLGPGGRPYGTRELTKGEALGWWRVNRYTPAGLGVLATWKPEDVMDLDVALARSNLGEGQTLDPSAME